MKRDSATIKKISAAWNKALWGFYDLQKPLKTKTEISTARIWGIGFNGEKVKIKILLEK